MNDIIGFVLFLVLMIISVIGKVYQDRKAAQERKNVEPTSVDDLPEATRRILFGDLGDVIVAKPRKIQGADEATAAAPPEPMSARRTAYDEEGPRQPPRPEFSRPAPMQTAMEARPPRVAPQQHAAPRPQHAAPRMPQQLNRPTQRQGEPLRRRPKETVIQPVQARRPAPAESPQIAASPSKPRKRAESAPHPARKAAGLTALLHSRNELARGIVLREILGPPKALDDLRF